MRKLFKKGFTLVELVVVVAIIAILSGVSVAAYVGITDRANKAADEDVVAQLNLTLTAKEARYGKNQTCYDALQDAKDVGFDVLSLIPNETNAQYVWDQENDRFALINGSEVLSQDSTRNLTSESYKIWTFGTSYQDSYSLYFTGASAPASGIINISAGFDAGDATGIKEVNYTNTGVAKDDIIIRTNEFGTKLTVNAPNDDIRHYGYAGLVTITAVADDTYVEHGTIGRIELTKGHVRAAYDTTIYELEAPSSSSYVTIDSLAKVYGYDAVIANQSSKSNSVLTNQLTAKGCSHNCGSSLVFDGNNVYEVCKKCGYTLVTIGSSKMTVSSANTSSGGNVISPKATYSSATSVNANTNGNIVVDETLLKEAAPTIVEDPSEECNHIWTTVNEVAATCQHTGLNRTTCSLCGGEYTTETAKVAHQYTYTSNDDGTHSISCSVCHGNFGSEECTYNSSDVCEHCGYAKPAQEDWSAYEVMEEICSLMVQVTDTKGQPYPNAKVYLQVSANKTLDTTTDSKGFAQINEIGQYISDEATQCQLTVKDESKDLVVPNSQPIKIKKGFITTKSVQLVTASTNVSKNVVGDTSIYSVNMGDIFGTNGNLNTYSFEVSTGLIESNGDLECASEPIITYVGGSIQVEEVIKTKFPSGLTSLNSTLTAVPGAYQKSNGFTAQVILNGKTIEDSWDFMEPLALKEVGYLYIKYNLSEIKSPSKELTAAVPSPDTCEGYATQINTTISADLTTTINDNIFNEYLGVVYGTTNDSIFKSTISIDKTVPAGEKLEFKCAYKQYSNMITLNNKTINNVIESGVIAVAARDRDHTGSTNIPNLTWTWFICESTM